MCLLFTSENLLTFANELRPPVKESFRSWPSAYFKLDFDVDFDVHRLTAKASNNSPLYLPTFQA